MKADGSMDIACVSELGEERSTETFGFLKRGLHYDLYGSPLANNCQITASRLFKPELNETIDWSNKYGANESRIIAETLWQLRDSNGKTYVHAGTLTQSQQPTVLIGFGMVFATLRIIVPRQTE